MPRDGDAGRPVGMFYSMGELSYSACSKCCYLSSAGFVFFVIASE